MRTDTKSGRFYTIRGNQYPSVTTILGVIAKPALLPWAAKMEREAVVKVAGDLFEEGLNGAMPRDAYTDLLLERLGKAKAHTRALEKAGDIGSQVHSLIEKHLREAMGESVDWTVDASPEAELAFAAWQGWAAGVELKPLAVEMTVYHDSHEYAGTMDLLAEVDGVVTLVDWKTGKAVYPEAFLQNAAYREAVISMDGLPHPEAGLIVRLPKGAGDVQPVPVPTNHDALFEVFLDAKAVWHWQYANEQARNAARRTAKVMA